jgi:hypothetical protein
LEPFKIGWALCIKNWKWDFYQHKPVTVSLKKKTFFVVLSILLFFGQNAKFNELDTR